MFDVKFVVGFWAKFVHAFVEPLDEVLKLDGAIDVAKKTEVEARAVLDEDLDKFAIMIVNGRIDVQLVVLAHEDGNSYHSLLLQLPLVPHLLLPDQPVQLRRHHAPVRTSHLAQLSHLGIYLRRNQQQVAVSRGKPHAYGV